MTKYYLKEKCNYHPNMADKCPYCNLSGFTRGADLTGIMTLLEIYVNEQGIIPYKFSEFRSFIKYCFGDLLEVVEE
jgi:hypothetical protein